MPITGKAAAIYKAAGTSVTLTGAATTKDVTNTIYTITDSTKRYLDPTQAVTVKKNGIAQAANLYTLVHLGGVVTFNSALIGTDVVTIDGKYIPLVEVANMFDWKLDLDANLKEITTFSSQGWTEYISLIKSWSGSAEGYWANGDFAGSIGQEFIYIFYVDTTGSKRYEGSLLLGKNSIETPCDDVVKETVDFQGNGALYYREG